MTDGQLLEGFLARRDGAAFESVVLRHGPMVLRVCRDVLADPHDAEDAFQATFLILVRNAGSIRDRDSLGRWLYEVAHRVAVRAKGQAARRHARERQGVAMAAVGPASEADRHELRAVLHAELTRLPERFRDPLVLCYMEGLTYEQAARRLDCPVGTLKARLAKGREALRSRLARRGLAVTAAILLMMLTPDAEASVPEKLVDLTVESGRRVAGGAAPADVAPPRVAELAAIRPGPPLPSRRQAAMALLLAVAVLGNGNVVLQVAKSLRPRPRPAAAFLKSRRGDGSCGLGGVAVARPLGGDAAAPARPPS
jgi:RNA polymerase sigma factor (sigma-70 family)